MTAETKAPLWAADNVERWPIDDLLPYARNSRTHSDAQIAQIVASMKEFGWTIPVLVDEEGTILAGHGRVLAARVLRFEEVPVIVARGWSEAKKRAYVIADNKIAENAGWDLELLRVELADLGELGMDLETLGFNDAEVAKLLADDIESADEIEAEWEGMPEFDQQEKKAFRTLPLHFKDQAAVDEFAELIGQKITEKTRFVWFPEIEIERYADKRYAAEPSDEAAISDLSPDQGAP